MTEKKTPKLSSKEARELVLDSALAEQIDLADDALDEAALAHARMTGYTRDVSQSHAFRTLERTGNRREYLRGVHDGRIHARGVFEGAGLIVWSTRRRRPSRK